MPARKAAKTESKAELKKNSIFGEYNEDELYKALGIEAVDDNINEPILTAPEGIENSAEERERLEKELMAELNKTNEESDKADTSIFGSQEEADAELLAELGINPDERN